MKKKNVLKIAWVLIICTAVFASCLRSEAGAVKAHAEESDTEKWMEYGALITQTILDLAQKPTKANAAALSLQLMIASVESIETANDATVFNDCASVIYHYEFVLDGVTTFHSGNLVGNPFKRIESSDGVVTHTFDTYPDGCSVQGVFDADYSTITLTHGSDTFSVKGNPAYTQYWSAPYNVTGSTLPFAIVTSGSVRKESPHYVKSGVLGVASGSVWGADYPSYTSGTAKDVSFHLPEATTGQSVNEYLPFVYTAYEEKYGIPFDFTFPESLPTGLILPDGSVSGGEEDATGDININVEVEFPTHLVPDVPEPDTFDYSQIQQVEIPLANEGVIKATWISGFSALVDTMVYTMDAFHLRDLVLLLCVVGIFVYLIVRW